MHVLSNFAETKQLFAIIVFQIHIIEIKNNISDDTLNCNFKCPYVQVVVIFDASDTAGQSWGGRVKRFIDTMICKY